MQRRHWISVIALVGLAAASAGHAQAHGMFGAGRHGPDADPARLIERFTRHLDLDETQQAQVENILEAARPEIEALRERAETNRAAIRELDWNESDQAVRLNDLAVESGQIVTDGVLLMGRVRSEFRGVLTAEQIAEMEAMTERWHDRRDERRGPRRR